MMAILNREAFASGHLPVSAQLDDPDLILPNCGLQAVFFIFISGDFDSFISFDNPNGR